MARKKWVNRQVNPVKDRLNELDQLSAKNAADIKDFDSRAQAGIHQAQTTADSANATATTASTTATQAQQVAQHADTQTAQLSGTIANLDQYKPLTDTRSPHSSKAKKVTSSKSRATRARAAMQASPIPSKFPRQLFATSSSTTTFRCIAST
jgi:methyl-accepting chemotaxis protein